MDAASLCSEIRSLAGCERVPLLMVIAGAGRETAPADPGIEYLSKPVKFEDLQGALLRHVLLAGQGESAGI